MYYISIFIESQDGEKIEKLSRSSKDETQKAKETIELLYQELQTIPGYFDLLRTRIDRLLDVVLYNALKDTESHR